MKCYSILLSLLLFTPNLSLAQTTVMTYNIRYNNPNDGADWWEERKTEVVDLLQYYQPDLLGIQEALPAQTDFLDEHLQNHTYIGFGRDGEGTNSEGAPIFYDTTQFVLLDEEVIWLSPTPDKISRGWDAALNRITVYGVFRNLSSGDTLHLFNCHFDHQGEIARVKSAELLIRLLVEKNLTDKAIVVMGDLNCEPTDMPMQLLSAQLMDTYEAAPAPYGPLGTFNGFATEAEVNRRIDYVLSRNLQTLRHRIIDDRRQNNRYPSDHFPVLVELDIAR